MKNNPSLKATWTLSILAPASFLLAIIAASIYFGTQGQTDPRVIEQSVGNSMPVILVIIQLALLGLFLWVKTAGKQDWKSLGWKLMDGQTLGKEIIIGAIPGLALGLLYVFALSPLLTMIQRSLGDFVPAGEILPSMGKNVLAFLIADVLLAPFVEENIYRGYILPHLSERFSIPVSILLSCILFGVLHWAGGFWYIILVGFVAGGLFAGLRIHRGSIIPAYSAHLALNLVEFLFVLFVH